MHRKPWSSRPDDSGDVQHHDPWIARCNVQPVQAQTSRHLQIDDPRSTQLHDPQTFQRNDQGLTQPFGSQPTQPDDSRPTQSRDPGFYQSDEAGATTSQLVQETRAMRGVVRHMVYNMESVLTDLQAIVGDIQSLVVQIDSVTSRIDQQCRTCLARGSPAADVAQDLVRQPQVLYRQSPPSLVARNPLYSRLSAESTAGTLADCTRHRGNSCHSVVHVRACRRDNAACGMSQNELPMQPRGEVSAFMDNVRDSVNHYSKVGGVASPSGGIAIVYPTIKSVPRSQSDPQKSSRSSVDEVKEGSSDTELPRVEEGCVPPPSSCWRNATVHMVIQTPSAIPIPAPDPVKTRGSSGSHQNKPRSTSVYNRSYQPVTPTEQRSPAVSVRCRHSKLDPSGYSNRRSPLSAVQLARPHRVSCPTPDKSCTMSSSSHKYCTIGSSGFPSLRTEPEDSAPRFVPCSPVLTRYSPRTDHAPRAGQYESLASGRPLASGLGTENYYFSIESDLDSEALLDNLENRSMTPDMDWSYLSLVGNQNSPGRHTRKDNSPGSDHEYEVPLIAPTKPSCFPDMKFESDSKAKLPEINVENSPYDQHSVRFLFQTQNLESSRRCSVPVALHVFCNDVATFQSTGYCGCYESVLDSVLENLAGFESFEEACEDLDSSELMVETYISFEDQFEEDDWDMGMQARGQAECDMAAYLHTFYDYQRGLLLASDTNCNLFSPVHCLASDTSQPHHPDTNIVFDDSLEDIGNLSNPNELKISRSSLTAATSTKKLPLLQATKKPFSGSEYFVEQDAQEQLKNSPSSKACIPRDLSLFPAVRGRCPAEYEVDMSSSDDTSCQAIGSGSPMSFSSPEAAMTSPDTDRFVTSSEGDDLLTSQEEVYFLGTDNRVNANIPTNRASMVRLRHEFFESLYNVCDKKEQQQTQETSGQQQIPTGEAVYDRIDNTRDNMSDTGSFQEDLVGYNKSINTWTTYALVHLHAEDMSDTASDIFNDNNLGCSLTSSYIDADNIGAVQAGPGFSF